MQYAFPSREWAVAFMAAVNNNAAYRQSGKDWTFGKVAMVIEAAADLGIAEDTGMLLDVLHGECRGVEYREGEKRFGDAEFIIIAPYSRWREVIEGQLDPIKGMMEGKLKLEKGHLPTMIRFVHASRELVSSATQVPTQFLS